MDAGAGRECQGQGRLPRQGAPPGGSVLLQGWSWKRQRDHVSCLDSRRGTERASGLGTKSPAGQYFSSLRGPIWFRSHLRLPDRAGPFHATWLWKRLPPCAERGPLNMVRRGGAQCHVTRWRKCTPKETWQLKPGVSSRTEGQRSSGRGAGSANAKEQEELSRQPRGSHSPGRASRAESSAQRKGPGGLFHCPLLPLQPAGWMLLDCKGTNGCHALTVPEQGCAL